MPHSKRETIIGGTCLGGNSRTKLPHKHLPVTSVIWGEGKSHDLLINLKYYLLSNYYLHGPMLGRVGYKAAKTYSIKEHLSTHPPT